MKRKLFCELCPLTYWLSKQKNIMARHIANAFSKEKFAVKRTEEKLLYSVFEHSSVIRRVLGNVDMTLQENKAENLALAAPKVNGVLIYPGEVFSFWKLVGKCSASKGYKKGLTISKGKTAEDIGGGMCQFTNLIHWMVLHSPLDITEHHHHDGYDLFPDNNRKVPFGTGTSIAYNYLDYRVKNNTDKVFQFVICLTETHLCGELLCDCAPEFEYVINTENEKFIKEKDGIYRTGYVYRTCKDISTGKTLWSKCIRKNHARVMYDTSLVDAVEN